MILYGKIRAYAAAGTEITITSGSGSTRTATVPTGKTFVDVILPGLEEYTLTAGASTESLLLDYNAFMEVTL